MRAAWLFVLVQGAWAASCGLPSECPGACCCLSERGCAGGVRKYECAPPGGVLDFGRCFMDCECKRNKCKLGMCSPI